MGKLKKERKEKELRARIRKELLQESRPSAASKRGRTSGKKGKSTEETPTESEKPADKRKKGSPTKAEADLGADEGARATEGKDALATEGDATEAVAASTGLEEPPAR